MTEAPTKRKIQRFFTKADFEAGLCDANGCAIPGGPSEPKKRDIKDSVPTKAQEALAPVESVAVETSEKPVGNASEGGGTTAVDPLSLDPKPAETGFGSDSEDN